MECCDSVSDDRPSGPCINQPPGICSPPSSMLLLLQRENTSHLNSASPPNQGDPEWRKEVKGQSKEELRAFGDGHEEEEGIDKQVDDFAVGDFLERRGDIREGHEKGGDEADEVECRIIYQADGSAYILESQSKLPCNVVESSSRPPFVNTCHFSSSQSSNLNSFHVFHPKNWCHLAGDILALLTCQSKDRAPAITGSSEAELALLGKEQPVLVCFLCRLLFSCMHAFRGHISQHHSIMLSIEEQQLLSLEHTCAILQPVGPSNHPLLSFLEPKTSNVPTKLTTTALGHNMVAMLSQEDREHLQISEPGLPLQPSLPGVPLPTSVLSPAKDPSTLGREGPQRSSDDGGGSREGEERLSSEVVSTAEDGASSIGSSGRQGHITEPALSNQSNPKSPNSVTVATSFMNNTKTLTDSELECGTSFNCHGPAPVSSTVQTSSTVTTPKELSNQESAMEIEPNNLSENCSAMVKEPNGKLCNDNTPDVTNSDLPSNHSNSQSPTVTPPLTQNTKSQLEDGQVDVGSRGSLLAVGEQDFVVGQETVQGSSYSFGGQVNMAHSRNSCKTLKCPKCNWHYKYQQTLEAHMKEKHPDSEDGQCPYCASGQNHPRLARGETYTCGYKPFRCQVCQYSTTTKGNLSIHMQSDKHLNNMQNLQSQTRPDAPTVQPSPLSHTHSTQTPSPSPSKVQGRASWRCEVCDYETNVARNLRIHMTSEKHTHNMLLLQQNLAHMQRQHRQNAAELYPYCQPQTRLPDPTSVIQPGGESVQEAPRKPVDEDPPEALFECALCGNFSSDSLVALSQHLAMQRSLPDADWRGTTGDAHLCRLCHYATPLRANFQLHCQTDKHLQRYQLAAHLQEASRRHGNPEEEEEWMLRCVAAGVQVQLRCNACSYEANSMEKLKLHTMNSRHKASLRLYKYLQQFEEAVSDGGSLHCALCDYSTQNSLSLVQHANSLSHQRGEGLLRLQRIQNGLQDEEEELGAIFEIRKNHANVNEMESPAEITSDQADQTKHASKEGEKTEAPIHGDKKPNEPSVSPKRPASGDTDDTVPAKRPRAQEEISTEQVRQCPFCRFCHTDLGRLRSHVMIQHAVQPTLRCPLCQDTLRSVALMRSHLTHLHSVTADCTQKLINAVIASDVLPEKMFLPVPDSNTQQTKADSSCNGIKRPDTEQGEDEEERVTTCRPEMAKALKQPLEDAESTKENTAAFPCWLKGCNKVLTSSSALQTHVNHFHSQRLQMPVSDRHVYKYRCSQCSLAFKTAEKLQQHSQYHAIRAATMCCLCQRSFRTIQALQKHLETSHLELSEIQLQQLCGSLLMTEDLLVSEDQGLDEEQGTFEEEKVKEDEESDLDEKISPPESVLSLAREDAELNPKPSVVPQRKGPNLSTEKFLDPSRPFKCTVCKESFTQKNILLVHYNSVSHLHKVKRSVQDSSAALPESVSSSADHKPFKCSICNVAYSQSSTLEIHMRSVLHQTKARAAKLDSSASSSTSVNPLLRKVVSDNATASSPTVLKPTNAMNNTSSTTSAALDQTQLKHQQSNEHGLVSTISISSHSEESKKKPVVDVMSTTNQHKLLQQQQQLQQQQLAQAQAQIQQELQKKAALLQSHLFNPALLHHFPITTDTLLPLQQQQQLLLPFLIPGGEFQISPELNLKELNLSKTKPVAPENCSEPSQQGSLISSCKQPLNGVAASTSHQSVSLTPEDNVPVPQQASGQLLTSDSQIHKGIDGNSNKETKELHKPTSNNNIVDFKAQDEVEDEVEDEDSGEFFTDLIPPRVAHDAPGNVSKALLENIGFELVMQFNENKQQYQRSPTEVVPNGQTTLNTKEVHNSDSVGKLECESCGKRFSNALILKSHKEHVHQSVLPIQSVEKFAKDYREQYDKLFPFTPSTPDVSPSLPSPASPALPPTDPTQQKPVSCIPASTTTVTPPTVSNPQVPLAPIPLPIDLPLFPPLLMHSIPLPALPPQLPVHLPPVEAGLTSDLAQLYQQQLTPAMLQQQGKRPRTRITDDQLRVLRQYFDINNSPNEDQIEEMANKSGLPNKVIKHWFRNTLFKERQRNKDSPYNFNNPPITTLEDVKVDSRPASPELPRPEFSGGRRSSRTRFNDYQLRVLQDFFDANAYPKDDEFEQLSNLLNLPTRVIVVWFQNARQKARKSYENQGDGGKESECREFSNDRYIRTANSSYECKKCNMVFQRIFDLISHQKKVCFTDDSDDVSCHQNELFLDPKPYSPHDTSSFNPPPSSSSLPNCTELSTDGKPNDKEQSDPDTLSVSQTEDPKPVTQASCGPEHCLENSKLEAAYKQTKRPNDENIQSCSKMSSQSPLHQHQQTNPSMTQTSPVPSQSSQMSSASPSTKQQHLNQAQQMSPYHCIHCKLSFPSFDHWQEHQQMHFLVAQNHFVPPQFLDRTMDIPLMLFDSTNPLVARQVLSGAFPQISLNSPTTATIPDSTVNSLKRRLEPKSGSSALENDWEHSGDDSQRDKRMRTTITPEQLEILYQKYLLDSNPTRQMLDHISQEVGLKKRVVQVWFQNTRARERKGQFRGLGPAQAHRRCPFCRALFKAQTALDAHIRSRHWHEAKNAGFSMAIASMTQDQEGSQMKMDLFNFSNSSQMPNTSDGLNGPDSPTCKSMDLSSHHRDPSPKPLVSGGVKDLEGSSTSVQQSFECGNLDNHKGTSMNIVPNGTITDEENYSEGKQNSIDNLSCSSEREASSENEDKISSGLVSPAMSFNAKDYENDLVLDYSETSSLADPASPSPGGSNSQSIDSDRPGQRRYRTQLSNLQVKVLKACFSDYKTPTMLECEALGNDIGLPKRVVQVWFQNARAKEKKAKLSLAKQFGTESTRNERPKTECTLCCVKYSGCLSVRDHVFSQQHLAKVKEALGGQIDRDREVEDFASVPHQMTEPEMSNLKKANEIMAVVQTQSTESSATSSHTTPQYSNLLTTGLPGTGSKSLSSSSTKPDPIDPASNGPSSKPNTLSSSSMSAANDKTPVSTNNSVSPPKPIESELQLQLSKESNSENGTNPLEKLERASADSATHSNYSISKEKQESLTPAASTPKPVKDYNVDLGQLQTLQAAGNTDQTPLLSNPLLPCLMPGFPPMFSPQIPAALTGSFLQPMFGMDSMFQYSPVLPQALMGLSPGSILQQYQHNLQGALMHHRLQLQKKQLLQQSQKPKASQISATTYSQDMAYNKDLVLNLSKPEEKQASSDGEGSSSFSSGTTKQLDDGFLITQCIVSKGASREGGKDVCLYDCLACEISLNGNEELIQHLEYRQHRQRAVEHLNAKEHASRLLPHVSPSSTSQPNPPSNPKSPSKSLPKQSASDSPSAISCLSRPTDQLSQTPSTSTALSGAAQSSCTPASPSVQVSLHSTVTSSLNGNVISLKPTDSVSGSSTNDGAAEEKSST
ncbi:zinc finger homeobox protein 3 isoform X2 [Ictalurus punctatus]|uniref:Zinc finger homeobox protein 3 isoform X2 n=1 Tax=Ictalurus punctatus TaxID=7998 RepID=A0A2D0QTY1_ICTPU|nr:zinc finger homeobox protein 3 isoform X2 [Ictalurus punctatus]